MPSLIRGVGDWAQLLDMLPRTGMQLLTRAERGELEVSLRHQELGRALVYLDRLANRLALSILLAALIVGLAFAGAGLSSGRTGRPHYRAGHPGIRPGEFCWGCGW
jgi:hypothetical protein